MDLLACMFERIKIINGQKYRYLVKNIRIGNSVKQKVVKYLGPVDPIYKKEKSRKSNAWLFTRKVNELEMKKLRKAIVSSLAFTRDRARIILLSLEGKQCSKISESINCEERKVRKAIKAFNMKGLDALYRGKAKGAKPKFSREQRAEMLMIASTEPQKLDLYFTAWSLPKLRKYFIENEIVDSISIESIRQLLKSEGIKLKKSKRRQYSNDPDFAKKN